MKKLFIFDVDYISLPCSVLSTVGNIIVCKDTLRRPNNTETWNVLEVHIPTHPPQNHGLFFEKEKAVFFAEKLIELSNNPTIETMADQELKWGKLSKAFIKINDEKLNNDPIYATAKGKAIEPKPLVNLDIIENQGIRIFAINEKGERKEITDLYWFEENYVEWFDNQLNTNYTFEIFVNDKKVYPAIEPKPPTIDEDKLKACDEYCRRMGFSASPIDTTDQRREYKDYEFCKAIKCNSFKIRQVPDPRIRIEECTSDKCQYTAIDFHKWLKENGFVIKKCGPVIV